MSLKKVLIVTYYWPPAGGAAVYRVTKFCKYLIQNDWEPIILTVNEAESSQSDQSLLKELPEGIKIFRTSSIEPTVIAKKLTGSNISGAPIGAALQTSSQSFKSKLLSFIRLNFFIPDAKIGWIPFAFSQGKKIIEQEKPDLIFSTSPPPTVHLIAKKLKTWSNIPWVADFRDPWTNIYYYDNFAKENKATKKNAHLENECLSAADKITVVNNGFFNSNITDRFKTKFVKISNGFDPSDSIHRHSPSPEDETFTIRYLGHFKNNQFPIALKDWLLTISENHELSSRIKIEFIGFVDEQNKDELSDPAIKVDINYKDFVDRDEAMKLMSTSNALLLCIGGGQSKKYGLSLKLFDYLLHQKPIIGFGPVDGDAAEILRKTNAGKMFKYKDLDGLSDYMTSLIHQKKEFIFDSETASEYSVPLLTDKLINVFNSLVKV